MTEYHNTKIGSKQCIPYPIDFLWSEFNVFQISSHKSRYGIFVSWEAGGLGGSTIYKREKVSEV
jgi:hypothetical protein